MCARKTYVNRPININQTSEVNEKMPMLYLKCKTCGVKFASGIAADKKSFETLTLSNNSHQCSKGHVHSYNTKDYFFLD